MTPLALSSHDDPASAISSVRQARSLADSRAFCIRWLVSENRSASRLTVESDKPVVHLSASEARLTSIFMPGHLRSLLVSRLSRAVPITTAQESRPNI